MKDQQEAEKRKVTSQEIQEQLRVQTQSIKFKRVVVLGDLAKVEPAVKEAPEEWSALLSSLLLSMCMKLPLVTGYFVPVLSKWPLTQTFVLAKKCITHCTPYRYTYILYMYMYCTVYVVTQP